MKTPLLNIGKKENSSKPTHKSPHLPTGYSPRERFENSFRPSGSPSHQNLVGKQITPECSKRWGDKSDGVLRCSRYSFGPNRLHYCGPDANREMLAYLKEDTSDFGLAILLRQFKTLFPYLKLIAEANGLKDHFDQRVVEAYWIGNKLLDRVGPQNLYQNLTEEHNLKKKLGLKNFTAIENKIERGALPHHSFHVFNVWKRTGHLEEKHTLESMDECRVSWGLVQSCDGPFINVSYQPLCTDGYKLFLGNPVSRRITRHLDSPSDIGDLKIGDIISIHWGVPCEVLSRREILNLKKYTLESIRLANGDL